MSELTVYEKLEEYCKGVLRFEPLKKACQETLGENWMFGAIDFAFTQKLITIDEWIALKKKYIPKEA